MRFVFLLFGISNIGHYSLVIGKEGRTIDFQYFTHIFAIILNGAQRSEGSQKQSRELKKMFHCVQQDKLVDFFVFCNFLLLGTSNFRHLKYLKGVSFQVGQDLKSGDIGADETGKIIVRADIQTMKEAVKRDASRCSARQTGWLLVFCVWGLGFFCDLPFCFL
ncbi:hypothetical protein LA303_11215 [Candidatus Sulfidibacterium hydrothermale]|uniref:hypothetical protein n=1 Tax=Candidatus Sulfidibacterium hydrothermale TaxID=2875962 RepID=UPI001F0A8F1F|nr:hypothetical protein [Candidatus Sulfidibacterium hydrothermale]UBM61968.1 hypothetical protein LA303_11215 [Candidatus Sulfidibacterium hydrothermale]